MAESVGATSYSTIFQCNEGSLICTLRFMQGVVSLCMLMLFARGYKALSAEEHNRLSKEDKQIYLLGMAQTLSLTVYYFLAEEFFVLATIRNLYIWVSINILHVLCKIYWFNNPPSLVTVGQVVTALKVLNFLSWFIISLGDGSSLVNTSFNLGYNCQVIDWILLSGFLLVVATLLAYVAFSRVEHLILEIKKTPPDEVHRIESIESERVNIILTAGCTFAGALVMFFWDYIAYTLGGSDEVTCTAFFSGNTFFRNILCFLLKMVTMQLTPMAIFYTTYYKRKDQFLQTYQVDEGAGGNQLNRDLLDDDAASVLNRTLTSRMSSRSSLFEGSNR